MTANDKEKVTDLRYLTSLSEGNQEFVKNMVDAFLLEIPKEVSGIEEGIAHQDYNQIRSSAHKMKSTIPFVGIDAKIGSAVSEIEQLAKEKEELDKIASLFKTVKEVCSKAFAELSTAA